MMDKKQLYLSATMADLQQKASTKYVLKDLKTACRLMDKLYEKFESACIDRDEELAFIFAMRFLDEYSLNKRTFKEDVKYLNAMFSTKVNASFNKAEMLKESLQERYAAINAIKETVVVPTVAAETKETVPGPVTAQWLYRQLRSNNNVIIVDVRSRQEFDLCHVLHGCIVNVPQDELRPGCSVADVDRLVEQGDATQYVVWRNRGHNSVVIISDWNTIDSPGLKMVHDAVYKWDAARKINEPLPLIGGLQTFILHYPTAVTNSRYNGPQSVSNASKVEVDSIRYPDLDGHKNPQQMTTVDNKVPVKQLLPLANDQPALPKLPVEEEQMSTNDNLLDKSALFQQPPMKPISPPEQQSICKIQPCSPEPSNIGSPLVDRSKKPVAAGDKPPAKPHQQEEEQPAVMDDISPIPLSHPILVNRSLKPTKDKLSDSSRNGTECTEFNAKGGAKSIPPPTGVVQDDKTSVSGAQEKELLPTWIECVVDPDSKQVYYVDHQAGTTYRTLPDEYRVSPQPTTFVDRIESLKDHSARRSGTGMKRSSSQPNLSEEHVSTSTITATTDSSNVSSGSVIAPLPNRLMKPSTPVTVANRQRPLTHFSATQINNFSPTYRSTMPGLTGLRNMGNTCYLNSVVQALSNTKFLANYILTESYLSDINTDNPLGHRGQVVVEFAQLVVALWAGKYGEVSPADFKRVVDAHNEMFRGREQHDSQEFLIFLLDGLHEDLNQAQTSRSKAESVQDEQQLSESQRADIAWSAHLSVNDSVIVRLFQGQFRSRVSCDHCSASSVTFDAFMYLSLPLVPGQSRCSLFDCIRLFLAEERMTDACQWLCPRCKVRRDAHKKIDIWKLPPYLLIHLKRFSCTGQFRQKLNTLVEFPLDTLDLSELPVCSGSSGTVASGHQQQHNKYHLYAVSNHHGNMEAGHYTSYCRNARDGHWYCYDDDSVTRMTTGEVRTSSAYILFYESYNIKQAGYQN